MSVYLQFESSSRSAPYILSPSLNLWVPNDNYPNSSGSGAPYQTDPNAVQSPTNYKVYYRELNQTLDKRTITFLEHCKEKPENLTFSVENCFLTLPSSAAVPRMDPISGKVSYVSVINEPYVYIRVMPIDYAEGDLIYSNNPVADKATFIVWLDRTQFGQANQAAVVPAAQPPNPAISYIPGPVAPTAFPDRPVENIDTTALTEVRWYVYKTCMATVMRLRLDASQWQIRIFDRYGNDVMVGEADQTTNVGGIGFTNPPGINPDIQTSILMGIRPNY